MTSHLVQSRVGISRTGMELLPFQLGAEMASSVHTARYKRFLEKLREARIDAGLTQVEAAEALGVHQSWLSKSETGERRIDVIELERLAALYGKRMRFFLEGA